MKSALATASSALALSALLLAAALAACSPPLKPAAPGAAKTAPSRAPRVLASEAQGGSEMQVTQTDEDGVPAIRVTLRRRGETHTMSIRLDDPIYQISIPVSFDEAAPANAARTARPQEIEYQDILIAQYLDKAKEFSRAGDHKEALRQVDLVLLTRPEHYKARTTRGSILYAMGDTARALEEWERVLKINPESQDVRAFMEFLKSNKGGQEPPLP